MGTLTPYLQRKFADHCPAGWSCTAEEPVLSDEMARNLGYSARADVLLARNDGSRRLWIEFEISRADPVANHAKFATANLFEPRPETDVFVSMVSAHVVRGRHNLAASTVYLMRASGMQAFQTLLLPGLPGQQIQAANHTPAAQLLDRPDLDVRAELDRALAISETLIRAAGHRRNAAVAVLPRGVRASGFSEDRDEDDVGLDALRVEQARCGPALRARTRSRRRAASRGGRGWACRAPAASSRLPLGYRPR